MAIAVVGVGEDVASLTMILFDNIKQSLQKYIRQSMQFSNRPSQSTSPIVCNCSVFAGNRCEWDEALNIFGSMMNKDRSRGSFYT